MAGELERRRLGSVPRRSGVCRMRLPRRGDVRGWDGVFLPGWADSAVPFERSSELFGMQLDRRNRHVYEQVWGQRVRRVMRRAPTAFVRRGRGLGVSTGAVGVCCHREHTGGQYLLLLSMSVT